MAMAAYNDLADFFLTMGIYLMMLLGLFIAELQIVHEIGTEERIPQTLITVAAIGLPMLLVACLFLGNTAFNALAVRRYGSTANAPT
eukprot:3624773-Prymnesium_polylepis.1